MFDSRAGGIRQTSIFPHHYQPLPLLASDQVLEEDAMYERDFDPHLDLFEDQIFGY